MSHELFVFVDERRIARLEYDAREDHWSLGYEPAWASDPQAFPLSPALPLQPSGDGHRSASIRRFIENLLPEGRALDIAASYNHVAKGNVFALIRALGGDTAGALHFATADSRQPAEDARRELPLAELDQRIAEREQVPFSVWDGRMRMSVAGHQDKLLVYLDRPVRDGGRLFLVEGRLASTHLLKPDSARPEMPHLVVNEHFCMSLARRMGLPAAEVELMRLPRPALLVTRFDRERIDTPGRPGVRRLHILDACQVLDLPVSMKYERNLGSNPEVRNIREGVGFERLFACAEAASNKAAARMDMLRWALYLFLVGNSDAHGKNYSFHVGSGGLLQPTPWYDLVSAAQYAELDTELAMAFGDVFELEAVTPFALADFAARCGIDRRLLRREAHRLCKLALKHASIQADTGVYVDDERVFAHALAACVETQAQRLMVLADQAVQVSKDLL